MNCKGIAVSRAHWLMVIISNYRRPMATTGGQWQLPAANGNYRRPMATTSSYVEGGRATGGVARPPVAQLSICG